MKSALPFTVAPKSLCILRLSAIGDVCHTLPVVRAIQDTWPETKLTWIIGKVEHNLIGDIPDIEFLVYDKSNEKQGRQALKNALKSRTFDALLHMQISIRSSRLSRLVKAPIKLGFDKPRAKDYQWLFTNHRIPHIPNQHVMDGLFGFSETIGAPRPADENLRWDIPLSDADKEFARKHIPDGQKTLVISPCSSQRARNFRNWSVENYVATAKFAQEKGMQVIVTGGFTELEKQYGDAIYKETGAVNLVAQTSLKQLCALLGRATALLSPDSGPAHMANAMKIPVIGLYATSNPYRTGPYLSNTSWVVNAYPEACQQYLNKPETELSWGKRVRHSEAMELITVAQVQKKLLDLANEYRKQGIT